MDTNISEKKRISSYQSSEKTRRALIDAAGALAAENGFNAVTTRAIADLAGENQGSIHYHFGGKDKLLEAVVEEMAESWRAAAVDQIIGDLTNATRQELAEVIRCLVRRNIKMTFGPDLPEWHCRVLYQLMQRTTPFFETFTKTVMIPEVDQIIGLMKKINPDFDEEMAVLHYYMMVAPLTFHTNYREAVLTRLDSDNYNATYIKKLEETCIRQALLALDLPLAKDE